jgi:hypothetical protein
MYTVIVKRGPKPDMVRTDSTETRAFNRADALLDLHGLTARSMTYNEATHTFTIDASEYYK